MLGSIKKCLSVSLILATFPAPVFAGGFYQPDEYLNFIPSNAEEHEFEIARLDKATRSLAHQYGEIPASFSNLRCFANLKNTPSEKLPRINLVYEMHGTDRSKLTTRKSLIDAAVVERSLLLLESDIGKDDFALRRTMSKYGLADVDPTNVRGLDANLQHRSVWFLAIFTNDLEEALNTPISKPAAWKSVREAFVEELTRNRNLREILEKVAKNNKKISGAAARELLHTANTLRALPAKTDAKSFLGSSKITSGNFQLLLYEMNKVAHKKVGLSQFKGRALELRIVHIGMNKRDEVFVDQIGKSVCEALEKGIKTINVIIGSGHRDNVKRRLIDAFTEAGVTNPDIDQLDAEAGETPSPKGLPQPHYSKFLSRLNRFKLKGAESIGSAASTPAQ